MASLGKSLRKVIGTLAAAPASVLPTSLVEETAVRLLVSRSRSLQADEALRLLFRIDSRLYGEQGRQAVRYGHGTHTKHRHMRYHDFFVDRVGAGEKVLDIGCGIGAVAFDVADRSGAEVVGMDYSRKNLQQAEQEYAHPRVRYVLGDVLTDLPDEKFDVVILSNVLEHLPDRSNFLRRVAQATNATRLLIRVPMFERDWRVPLKKELGVEWRLDDDHETEYERGQFEAEMAAAGLRVVSFDVQWGEIWSEVVCDVAHD